MKFIMNISNLLKSCIIACTVVLCANNNIGSATQHKVNPEVFQHQVEIINKEYNTRDYRDYIEIKYLVPIRKLYGTNYLSMTELYKSCADDHDEYWYP